MQLLNVFDRVKQRRVRHFARLTEAAAAAAEREAVAGIVSCARLAHGATAMAPFGTLELMIDSRRREFEEGRGEEKRRREKEKREGEKTESIGNFTIKWYLHVHNHHLFHPIRLLYLPKDKRALHM